LIYNEDAFPAIFHITKPRMPQEIKPDNSFNSHYLMTRKDLSDVMEREEETIKKKKKKNVLLQHIKAGGGKTIALKVHIFKYITKEYFITISELLS
jgi:hypothetical protein